MLKNEVGEPLKIIDVNENINDAKKNDMKEPLKIIDVNGKINEVINTSTLIGDENSKFRHIHFRNCINCVVNIDMKLVRCTFYRCKRMQIYIKSDLIGCIEFINSHLSTITYDKSTKLPYIQCDMSSKLVFCSNEIVPYERNYVCTQCMDIKSEWNDFTYILPAPMFTEQRIITVNHQDIDKSTFIDMKDLQKLGIIEECMMYIPK